MGASKQNRSCEEFVFNKNSWTSTKGQANEKDTCIFEINNVELHQVNMNALCIQHF